RRALQAGVVRMVVGEVWFDLVRGEVIASAEMIFAYVAVRLKPERIVLAGQVDGVYTADPLQDVAAERIAQITPATFPDIRARLGGSHGVDVTGGMLTKVALMIDLLGILPSVRAQIISGETSGLLAQALISEDNASIGT